jgi:hypothetical protein
LRRAVEDDGIDVDDVERGDEGEDGGAPTRDIAVGETCSPAKPIQRRAAASPLASAHGGASGVPGRAAPARRPAPSARRAESHAVSGAAGRGHEAARAFYSTLPGA